MKANILGVVVTAAGLATAVPDDQYPIVFPDDGNGTHTSFPAVQPQPISTVTSDIAAAAAMAKTESPVSSVKGKAFDRFMTIFLEINSYTDVINEPNCQSLIKQGLLQTNMYGTAEPSQPNYVAAASGDYFGDNNDSWLVVARNVSTVIDLLDDRGISWGNYNEGAPHTGFDGLEYSNPVEGNYARKHNLLMRFSSIAEDAGRLAKIKNLTQFYEDLSNKQIPQWLFITPNLDHNGHDTNIATSCAWTTQFLKPLLANSFFNDNLLVYITWEASTEVMTKRNHVAGIALGSALPKSLIGTRDSAYYNHYSQISTVEANWNLSTLGRWDVGANIFDFVGNLTGDKIRTWSDDIAGDSFYNYYWNQSYGGVFSSASDTSHVYPSPHLGLVRNGRAVLPAVSSGWRAAGSWWARTYYRDIIELPDALHPPAGGYAVPIGLTPPPPINTPITAYPTSTAPATKATAAA